MKSLHNQAEDTTEEDREMIALMERLCAETNRSRSSCWIALEHHSRVSFSGGQIKRLSNRSWTSTRTPKRLPSKSSKSSKSGHHAKGPIFQPVWFHQEYVPSLAEFGEFRVFIVTVPSAAGIRGRSGRIQDRSTSVTNISQGPPTSTYTPPPLRVRLQIIIQYTILQCKTRTNLTPNPPVNPTTTRPAIWRLTVASRSNTDSNGPWPCPPMRSHYSVSPSRPGDGIRGRTPLHHEAPCLVGAAAPLTEQRRSRSSSCGNPRHQRTC
jgi:hypothetical protein